MRSWHCEVSRPGTLYCFVMLELAYKYRNRKVEISILVIVIPTLNRYCEIKHCLLVLKVRPPRFGIQLNVSFRLLSSPGHCARPSHVIFGRFLPGFHLFIPKKENFG